MCRDPGILPNEMNEMANEDRQARLAFAVPTLEAPPEGIHLEFLDPEDPDNRAFLIRAAHAELDQAIDNREETVVIDGLEFNPRLHLAMHELVATQIIDDHPPEVWATAQRLREHGYGKHEILHMLASAMSNEIWHVLHDERGYDREAHLRALDALPDSWERQRPGGPAPPASRVSHASQAKRQRKAARSARRQNRRR